MIRLENISIRQQDNNLLLTNIDIFIASGSTVSIVGGIGAGKTSLLKCIGLLQKPTYGNVYLLGKNISKLSRPEISNVHKEIGIVFEDNFFIEGLSVDENIVLPLILSNESKSEAKNALHELMPWLNLQRFIGKSISNLSRSELKLVQFARAIISRPRILLLDEFFLGVENDVEKKIIYLLLALNKIGTTIIIFGKKPDKSLIKMDKEFKISNKQLLEYKDEILKK